MLGHRSVNEVSVNFQKVSVCEKEDGSAGGVLVTFDNEGHTLITGCLRLPQFPSSARLLEDVESSLPGGISVGLPSDIMFHHAVCGDSCRKNRTDF